MAPAPGDFWRHSHLGIQFVIIIIAFAWGGAWLDERVHAGGLAVLAGIFAGAAIGFYSVYRGIQRK